MSINASDTTPKEIDIYGLIPLPKLPLNAQTRSLFDHANPDVFKKMTDEELAHHIARIRDLADGISTWPCIRLFMWLPPDVRTIGGVQADQVYGGVIKRLCDNPSAKMLEMACFFGQDGRAMMQDGVRKEQIICADLVPDYFELGKELFADDGAGRPFYKLDIFDEQDVERLLNVQPKGFQVILANKLLQLFTLARQKEAVQTTKSLLANEPGATLFGCIGSVGDENVGPRVGIGKKHFSAYGQLGKADFRKTDQSNDENAPYDHSVSTFTQLLRQTYDEETYDIQINEEERWPLDGGNYLLKRIDSFPHIRKLTFCVVHK